MIVPPDLAERLRAVGQEHLIDAVAACGDGEGADLVAHIEELDLDLIAELVGRFRGDGATDATELAHVEPPDAIGLPHDDVSRQREREAREEGERRLRAGQVACVLLAGGQGTRLGFDGPKGDFPFAPITGRTLFWHHAAKIAALRARYRCELPFYVLTSPANDAVTRGLFRHNDNYGLPAGSAEFVVQGTMPAVDRETGRILLEASDRLALSPDGHGGVLAALRRSGALDAMADRGIRTIFTFQVDNPLVRIARPEFVGYHALADADMSSVVVRKLGPDEKMGVIAQVGGHTGVVEYSDLSDELAGWRDPDGALVLWAGSIAVHCLEVDFVRRLTSGAGGLPFHRALKKVPHVDPAGVRVEPVEPNGIKFETFLFDALPEAARTATVEAARSEEFSPIKNADGADSPASARRDLNLLYARWLESAGVVVPTRDGPPVDIEIDPRLALDARELRERLPAGLRLTGPVALGPEDSS